MSLPEFKYHPDPSSTGSIVKSDAQCECCGKITGYIYAGPVFSEEDLNESICPWCIANGEAHKKFDAEFTDYDGVGDYGTWQAVPASVKEEVAFRTPGFRGWQQERWWTHCNDAAIFLGPAGKADIIGYGKQIEEALKKEAGCNSEQWVEYLDALSRAGSPTAYIFKCRHCGEMGGYSDCD